jgi:cysteine desulfurase/selenocysteine lyase
VPLDVRQVREQFPALRRRVNGHPLTYLDSASTAQKPQVVLDAVLHALEASANIHRGVHTLSVEATRAYEGTRRSVARLLGGVSPGEVVFVRGTTEAVNLVAATLGPLRVGPGDEVLVTELEHHSNLVPWQRLCASRGARLQVLPIDDLGQVRLEALDGLLGPRTRLVAMSHASNSLGTRLPVAEVCRRAHAVGAVVLVDGAQAVVHGPVDVRALGCDLYAFSGHKLYGPTGAGALWGRKELLASMPPWQGGGDMVAEVELQSATYREPPHRFEAGTPDIVGVIGLGAAIEWFLALGPEAVAAHDAALVAHATRVLAEVPGLRFIGAAAERIGLVSFVLEGLHPHDVGTALDQEGIAIRTGHHCTQPVMDRFGVGATARASFGVHTTTAELDLLAGALERARALLGGGR